MAIVSIIQAMLLALPLLLHTTITFSYYYDYYYFLLAILLSRLVLLITTIASIMNVNMMLPLP